MTGSSPDRWLCGWRVRSDIPLPDLSEWDGDDRQPDITIRLGSIPARRGMPVARGPLLQEWPDGARRLMPKHHAIYDIDPAARVVVVETADPNAVDVRLFLLSTVLSALCLRHDRLPLHASAVVVGNGALAFVGPSGSGKSTLAAACLQRGLTVLADDVSVAETADAGPVIWPTFPHLKLCPDALHRLRLQPQGRAPNKLHLEKYYVSTRDVFRHAPVPLRGIIHLSWAGDGERPAERHLRGASAMRAAVAAVYRQRTSRRIIGEQQLLYGLGRMCAAVPVHIAARRSRSEAVEQFLDRLTAALPM